MLCYVVILCGVRGTFKLTCGVKMLLGFCTNGPVVETRKGTQWCEQGNSSAPARQTVATGAKQSKGRHRCDTSSDDCVKCVFACACFRA